VETVEPVTLASEELFFIRFLRLPSDVVFSEILREWLSVIHGLLLKLEQPKQWSTVIPHCWSLDDSLVIVNNLFVAILSNLDF
jgi:hypothetical protein